MKHSKIIKRENGTQFNIEVTVILSMFDSNINYEVNITQKQKGKRNWFSLPLNIPEYEYRRLEFPERREVRLKSYLNFVTEDEIYEAKLELWNLLKPKKEL